MPNVVTGISQDGNIDALTSALTAAKLSLEPLETIEHAEADVPLGSSLATKLIDTAILTGGGLETGTGVPGLTGSGVPGISGAVHEADAGLIAGESIWERLADLEIPDDEVENYVEALEAGRSLVAYHATPDNLAHVEAAFRTAGLAKIKSF